MNTGEVDVTIIIVCYNAKHFLRDCLESIRTKITGSYEVILLDNASVDGTVAFIRTEFPWVQLLQAEENLGFIKGNNLAARNARGKYYLLLNSDTVLMSDIAAAVSLLNSDQSIGIVGAEMRDAKGVCQPSTGRFPKPMLLWKFSWLWAEPERHPYGPARMNAFQVDWVQGSFLLTRAENWRALGGLDESYFFYGDDVEFCRSTWGRGLLTVYCPSVKYLHFGGFVPNRTGYIFAGYRRYHRKFSRYPERLLADIVLRAGLLARICFYAMRYSIGRDPLVLDRLRQFVDVNRNWAKTAMIAPRFD
jgi:GT2 family glycosyltransferase